MPSVGQTPLRLRRVVLLAGTIAGISGGALVLAPNQLSFAPAAVAQDLSQQARHLAQPTGFADIVEKVKPAVVAVRIKMNAGPQVAGDEMPFPKGSPMERFFRRFGYPEGGPGRPRGRHFGTAQGSGFLISEDGYAVTNNHV